jgi:hypothetical protein
MPKANPLSPAEKVIAHAFVLGAELGISQRDMAKAALASAVHVADKQGDPDRFLGLLMAAAMQQPTKGTTHGR